MRNHKWTCAALGAAALGHWAVSCGGSGAAPGRPADLGSSRGVDGGTPESPDGAASGGGLGDGGISSAIEDGAPADGSLPMDSDGGCVGAPDASLCPCPGTLACVAARWACDCGEDSGASTPVVSIDAAHPHASFEGWGMSLAWEGNALYGSSLNPTPVLGTDAARAAFLDLLYDPDTGLGLTVARYNIGGGENPTHRHMRPNSQMDGYLDAPPPGVAHDAWAANAANYDFSRDASQRTMLTSAVQIIEAHGGTPVLEAFSNSPPYWMTISQCASGNTDGSGNLAAGDYAAFASYLTNVVAHFASAWGVSFRTLEPFNEPDGNWWKAGGTQEGCAFGVPGAGATLNPANPQYTLVTDVNAALAPLGLTTKLSVTDANNVAAVPQELATYASFVGIAQMNTHSYSYTSTSRRAANQVATQHGLRISMSEVGCCEGTAAATAATITGALVMADTLRRDMAELRPTTWSIWQADWNILSLNGDKKPQYYALLQYMRFIRAGFAFLDVTSGGAEDAHTSAAYDAASGRLVVVVENGGASALAMRVDVSPFAVPSVASVYRTSSWNGQSSTADGSLTESFAPLLPVSLSHEGMLPVFAPPMSISTFVF